MDFTLKIFSMLLKQLIEKGFTFIPYAEGTFNTPKKSILIRHDVDLLPENALRTAQIENELGVRGTYYFRILPQSNRPIFIKAIKDLGHEIGYHYEDLTLCKGDMKAAIKSFEKNLAYFRKYFPVQTICMHGSPRSQYDSRDLWKHYNYRDFGIIAEPYFDTDFTKVLYFTDTGRRWDGDKVSIRDKVAWHQTSLKDQYHFHSTYDIIQAAKNNQLPDQIMFTFHPQRWTDKPLPWFRELIWQNSKNMVKRALVKQQNQ